jgi:hypothetical protein
MHPHDTDTSQAEQLIDELADILFEKWLQETNQTGYTIGNES